jgi:uncharacterized membrane protein (UPF0136 family)
MPKTSKFRRISGLIVTALVLLLVSPIMFGFTFLFLKSVALNIMMPSRLFTPMGMTLLTLASLVFPIWFFVSLIRPSKKTNAVRSKPNKQDMIKYLKSFCVAALLVGAAMGAVIGAVTYIQDRQSAEVLERALRHISVNPQEGVSEKRTNATLVEFEKQICRLRCKYEPSMNYEFTITLYANVSKWREAMSAPEGTGGSYRFKSGRHVIDIPAESGVNWLFQGLETKVTTGPGHETTHAISVELVGPQRKSSIPLWFCEGLAEYESLQGCREWLTRSGIRQLLWDSRAQLDEDYGLYLCSLANYPSGKTDRDIMYYCSFELIRYIVTKYDSDGPRKILDELGQGSSFESAFRSVLNHSCQELYMEWRDDFF